MPLETPTFVMDLVETNPPGTDAKSQGDNHIRNIKLALKNTFPTANRSFNLRRWAEKEATFETQADNRAMVDTDDGKLQYFDCSAAARTYNLLAVASAPEGMIVFIDRDASANKLTIDPAGTETVNGLSVLTLYARQTGVLYRASTEWRFFQTGDRTDAKGFIFGLNTFSDPGDLNNDINIPVGAARADDDSATIVLTSAIIGRADGGTWVVGTGQPKLDTGVIGNNTYHVFLIERLDTLVSDILFSLSPTAPVMPTNYTIKRRIASFIRTGGNNVQYRQVGNRFKRPTVQDRSNTAATAAVLLAVGVPTGIVVGWSGRILIEAAVSVNCFVQLGDAAAGNVEQNVCQVNTGASDSVERNITVIDGSFFTDTSAQIYFSQTNFAGTPTSSIVETIGWTDYRGQDGGV